MILGRYTHLFACLLIIVSSVALIYCLKPASASTPQGIYLPLNQNKFSESHGVKYYLSTPGDFDPLGHINVEILDVAKSDTIQVEAINYASSLAKMHGANGVVLQIAGYSPSMHSFILHAFAIKTLTADNDTRGTHES